jgi:putative inorganic carbon (HCO3(-)) transporter
MKNNNFSLASLSVALICLEIVLLPLTYLRFKILQVPMNIIEILVLINVIVVIIQRFRLKKELEFPYLWPSLLIVTGLILSTILLSDLIPALGIIKGWFSIPMLFGLTALQIITPRNLPAIIWAVAINVLFVSLYTLLQFAGVIPLLPHQFVGGDLQQYVEQGRALAYFESPNFIAMYLIPPTIFLAFLWKEKQPKLIVLLLLPLIAIYISRSRAGIVSLLIVLSLIALGTIYRKSRVNTAIGAVVALAIIAFYLATHVTFSGTDTLRLGIWRVAIDLIKMHPLIGVGPGEFLDAFTNSNILDNNLYQTVLQYALHPHNIFLNFWLSGGLLAISGFIWLLYQIFFLPYSTSVPTYRAAARWAIAVILIHGLFDSTYFKGDLAIYFWLFAALVAVDSHPLQDTSVAKS